MKSKKNVKILILMSQQFMKHRRKKKKFNPFRFKLSSNINKRSPSLKLKFKNSNHKMMKLSMITQFHQKCKRILKAINQT